MLTVETDTFLLQQNCRARRYCRVADEHLIDVGQSVAYMKTPLKYVQAFCNSFDELESAHIVCETMLSVATQWVVIVLKRRLGHVPFHKERDIGRLKMDQ